MSKYIVETFYTCSFKIVHELNELNEKNLSDIDSRQDGKVEVIDVTVNNRKTKKNDGENLVKNKDLKDIQISHSEKVRDKQKFKEQIVAQSSKKLRVTKLRKMKKGFKCPIEEKAIFKKLLLQIIKFTCIQESMMTVRLVKFL